MNILPSSSYSPTEEWHGHNTPYVPQLKKPMDTHNLYSSTGGIHRHICEYLFPHSYIATERINGHIIPIYSPRRGNHGHTTPPYTSIGGACEQMTPYKSPIGESMGSATGGTSGHNTPVNSPKMRKPRTCFPTIFLNRISHITPIHSAVRGDKGHVSPAIFPTGGIHGHVSTIQWTTWGDSGYITPCIPQQ